MSTGLRLWLESVAVAVLFSLAGTADAISSRCTPGAQPWPGYSEPCPDAAQLQLTLAPDFTDVESHELPGFVIGASVAILSSSASRPAYFSWGGRAGASADVVRGVFQQHLDLDVGGLYGSFLIGIGPGLREGRLWNSEGFGASVAMGLHARAQFAFPVNDNWNWTRFWRLGFGCEVFTGWEFHRGNNVVDVAPFLLFSYDFANFGG